MCVPTGECPGTAPGCPALYVPQHTRPGDQRSGDPLAAVTPSRVPGGALGPIPPPLSLSPRLADVWSGLLVAWASPAMAAPSLGPG